MADLNSVEKILVEKYGFTDRGDGTVAAPSGALYDSEQGGYYTETGASPVASSSSPVASSSSPVASSATAETDTLKGELPEYKRTYTRTSQVDRMKTVSGVIEVADGSKITVGYGGGTAKVIETDPDGKEYILYSGDNDDGEGWAVSRNIRQANELFENIQKVATSQEDVNIDHSKDVESSGGNFRKLTNASTTTDTGVTFTNKHGLASTNAVAAAAIKANKINKTAAGEDTPVEVVEETPVVEEEVVEEVLPVEKEVVEEVLPVVDESVVNESVVAAPVTSSNTEVLQLGQGEVAPIKPVPQTVVQQVTPPTYYNQPQQVTANNQQQQQVTANNQQQQQVTANNQQQQQQVTANTAISNAEAGTFSKPLQTAGLSAVPQQVTYKTHYAGTPSLVDPTLYAPTGGMERAIYQNNLGQQMTVTEMNGSPVSYVPPGFVRQGTVQEVQQRQATGMAAGGAVQRYAAGGSVDQGILVIARMNGFSGTNPQDAKMFMNSSEGLRRKAMAVGALMNKGGLALAEGGLLPAVVPSLTMQNQLAQNMMPAQANVQYIQPQAADFVPVDAGQATPIAPYAEAATVQTVQQASKQATPTAQTVSPVSAVGLVKAETDAAQAAQRVVSDQAQTTAQQQTTSSLTGMTGAQGTSVDVVAPAPRQPQTGELIDPVANAASASSFTEQIKAQTATPSAQATVQGQLEGLMQQFEGGNTPAWAAGSMRNATAMLAARGLGASSLAGQAVIQATMEAALPIAQMDAQVQAQFESQNLSNRQQRAMLAAQQRATFLGMEFDQAFQAKVQNSARIGDIANMNFTAEQNIALENSRAANTMNLNNLSNRQAMIMSEAAALANLDMANLNNRQQAAVQNAQSFLQMDMANLSNSQQTEMFKTQQNVQALFTDQAAENAAKQFNASSENQTDQYFANLRNQTGQFNASQQNAMDQFNVNSVNALREFNSQVQQQRDLFNAQNGLVIAQANAQWRQNLSTINTAAQNEANANAALSANAFTQSTLDTLWQRERDIMDYIYKANEAGKDRALSVVLADKKYAEYAEARADAEETAKWQTLAEIVTT